MNGGCRRMLQIPTDPSVQRSRYMWSIPTARTVFRGYVLSWSRRWWATAKMCYSYSGDEMVAFTVNACRTYKRWVHLSVQSHSHLRPSKQTWTLSHRIRTPFCLTSRNCELVVYYQNIAYLQFTVPPATVDRAAP